MIETYSKNITVAAETPIPLNNVDSIKGNSVTKLGTSTLQFNKSGIYEVTVSATANAEAAGDISVQLERNNVLQPQAISTVTAADVATLYSLGFTTLVQVPNNNCNCNCAIIPTTIEFVTGEVETTFDTIDVVVTKIC